MKRRPVPPPSGTGNYVWGGIQELVSEEERAGRPVASVGDFSDPISPSLPGSTARYDDDPPPSPSE